MAAPVRIGLTSSGSEPGVLPLNEGAVDGPGRSRTFIRRLTAARASVAAPAHMELPAGVGPASSVWRTEILNTAERRKRMAIRMGLEPTTLWQTARSSAVALPDQGLPRRSAGEKPNHKARLVVVSPLCHLSYGIFRYRRESNPHPAPWNGNSRCCPCFS